ncbi:hypothetical protein BDW60DRAFT_209059 [Aspergillus nidulans var. acristatus]
MDALHRVLANGVIAESVPGFVVTDARIMEIDTCVLRGALGLAAEEDIETSQALLYFARNITGLMTGLELKLRIARP